MLEITIPAREIFDEERGIFMSTPSQTLQLEHSLLSLSKWESKWHKPFLETKDLSVEELLDYIKFMTLTKNVDPSVYYGIDEHILKQIQDYIEDPMTATTITDKKKGGKKEIITAEILYYDMVALQIPFECQKWHLNRLLTLIQVCAIKNDPDKKKMSRREIQANNRALNEARKKKYKTKG